MTKRSTDDEKPVQSPANPNEVLRLLANDRRRQIVTVLDAWNESVIHFEELQQQLSSEFESSDSDNWLLQLRHVHLPILEQAGLVEYDGRNRTIWYDDCELVTEVLTVIESRANA
ncbi:ArsR family transcriptional regulator [Salinadaptatus halalkaliphilus]|uniref:ArsR family transcriptional regulator n=1 Tax=Salinadaptatus halalkaliphilus TaxID=2419781 RepID=A0A4S3THI6_9EURY|nr:ArsR family transcriptional regulator [Salinadaptatus halalkaliphilus]THE63439.1 ArsR family transcriptional regulator [Salinadaptatus halalkaliphilus]